ncbi:MAG: hypothetical protein AB7S26_17240 [Sandaracinaceae bacterium]
MQDSDARAEQFNELRARLDGHWVLATPADTARRTVDAAIERAVNAMNMLLRGMARPMIRDNTPINQYIELRFRSVDEIFCRFDTGARYTTPLGATRNGRSLDGETLRVTQRYREGALEQVFQADQGTRWNMYVVEADGTLRLDATTQGDMMPEPLRFSLTYRRRE